MNSRETAEAFLNALKDAYFNNTAESSIDYLRGECRLLSFLNIDRKRRLQPGELAAELSFSTSRIASLLRSLEKKSLITREYSTEDKRKVYVSLTDKGAEYIEDKRDNVFKFYERIFEQMSEQDCGEFVRLIRLITEITEKE